MTSVNLIGNGGTVMISDTLRTRFSDSFVNNYKNGQCDKQTKIKKTY